MKLKQKIAQPMTVSVSFLFRITVPLETSKSKTWLTLLLILLLKMELTCLTTSSIILGLLVVTVAYFIQKRRTNRTYTRSNLTGKVAIVTGSNTGIGKETARELAKCGATVIMACRDLEKANTAANDIKESMPNANLIVKRLDVASKASIRDFVENIKQDVQCIDILINNAGVFYHPKRMIDNDIEYTFMVNTLGPFYLTFLLLPLIINSSVKRIVNIVSEQHKTGAVKFDENGRLIHEEGWQQYANTKLMTSMFTVDLRRQYGHLVYAFAVDPGVVYTNISRHFLAGGFKKHIPRPLVEFFMGCIFKTPNHGCQTVMYCATEKGLEENSGGFFVDCELEKWNETVLDVALGQKLRKYCAELTLTVNDVIAMKPYKRKGYKYYYHFLLPQ